jgi:hypothetical protein
MVSFFTKPEEKEKINHVWQARHRSEEEEKAGDIYNIIPKTRKGRLSFIVYFSGVFIFVTGVLSGSVGWPWASAVAVSGMVIYFLGGYLRVNSN